MYITSGERQKRQEIFLSSIMKKQSTIIMVIITVANDEHKTLFIYFHGENCWKRVLKVLSGRCEANLFFNMVYK